MGSAASARPVVATSLGTLNQADQTNQTFETSSRNSSVQDFKTKSVNDDYEDTSEDESDNTDELYKENDEKIENKNEIIEEKCNNCDETEKSELYTFEDYHAHSVSYLQSAISITESFPNIFDENNEIRKEVLQMIELINDLYFIPKNVITPPLKNIKSHRVDIANICIDTKVAHTLYTILKHIYSRLLESSEDIMDNAEFPDFMTCLRVFLNYTDASENICCALCTEPGLLELMKTILSLNMMPDMRTQFVRICTSLLCIVHNITMQDSCVTHIRHVGFTEVVNTYLQLENEDDKLCSLSILAATIDDADIEIITTNKDTIYLLVDILRRGLDSPMRRAIAGCINWSCAECALMIRRLAGNDDNKQILVNAGCLELLVTLGKTAKNDDEKLESVKAIWALAFDQKIRKEMVADTDLGVVDLLSDLMESENQKIKQTCAGALWTIRKQNKSARTRRSAVYVDKTNPVDEHVMISYQWSDQKTVLEIRDCLEKAGFKVWIDINEMKGSIPTAMANAVENASVFLMCMSQKYQNSLNCQSEADYAYQLKKTIMPLKMEKGYQPRSWTGIICGSKKFYEFSGKYQNDLKVKELIRDLTGTLTELDIRPQKDLGHHPLSIVPEDVTDSVPIAMETPISFSSHVSKVTIDTIRDWKQTDVDKWIEKNNLKSCGINKRTGKEIALLIKMSIECPEFFYRCLETMWKIKDTVTLANIVWALTDLTQELEQKKPG